MCYVKVYLLILLLVCFQKSESANILILHPLYAGSHELTLRSIGNHLVKERGHNVTQLMFQHTNMNISLSSDAENEVDIIPLRIRDPKKECTQYINGDGQFDIGSFSIASFLWENGEKLWHFPTDLFCVTRVHCNMVLNDPILFESLNTSNFDIGTKHFRLFKVISILSILIVSSSSLSMLAKSLFTNLVHFLYVFIIVSIAFVLIFLFSIFMVGTIIAYLYFHYASMKSSRFFINI